MLVDTPEQSPKKHTQHDFNMESFKDEPMVIVSSIFYLSK